MALLGSELRRVFESMYNASTHSRWGKDRKKRESKRQKTGHVEDPLADVFAHLNANKPELFKAPCMHGLNSRCFLFLLNKFADTPLVADRLLQQDTRTAIMYKNKDGLTCVPKDQMRASPMYIFSFPERRQTVLPVQRSIDEWTEAEERKLLGGDSLGFIHEWVESSSCGNLPPDRATRFARDVEHLFDVHHTLRDGSIERKITMLVREGYALFEASFSSTLKMRPAKDVRNIEGYVGWTDPEERALLAEMAVAGFVEVPETGCFALLHGAPTGIGNYITSIPFAIAKDFVNTVAPRFEWHRGTKEIENKVHSLHSQGPRVLKDNEVSKARDAEAKKREQKELARLELLKHPRRNGILIGADGWSEPEERTLMDEMAKVGVAVKQGIVTCVTGTNKFGNGFGTMTVNPWIKVQNVSWRNVQGFAKTISHLFPRLHRDPNQRLNMIWRKADALNLEGPTAPKDDTAKASDTKNDDPTDSTSKAIETMVDDSKASDTKNDDSKASDTKNDDSKAGDTMADDSKASDTKNDDSKASDTMADDSKASDTATDNSKDEDWEVMTIKERTLYTNNLHNERTTALRRAVEEAAALKRAVQEANNTKARSIADTEDNDKYILMIVLPTVTRVSTAEVFKSLKDITPVGCVLPADFATAITKTGWRSMQTTPVDQFGQWRHIGLGRDSSQSPFLLRCSVAHASSQGIVASTP
jgi:hypothetical protein